MGQCSSCAQQSATEVDDFSSRHIRPKQDVVVEQTNGDQEVQVSVCLDKASQHSINIRIQLNLDSSFHTSRSLHKDICFTVSYMDEVKYCLSGRLVAHT